MGTMKGRHVLKGLYSWLGKLPVRVSGRVSFSCSISPFSPPQPFRPEQALEVTVEARLALACTCTLNFVSTVEAQLIKDFKAVFVFKYN